MWVKLDNVPDALHVYDIYLYGGRWFAAIGNDPSDGYAVVSSADSGQTWQKHYLPVAEQGQNLLGIARAWEFFEVGDDLLVSVLPPSRPELSGDSLSSEMTYYIGGSPVYRLVDGIEPQFEEVTDIDFFGGFSNFAQGWMQGRVARPVRYGLLTVYLGVDTTTDHNWTPFGLFSVDEAYQVRQYMLMENAHIWDLLVEDGILYALAAQPSNNRFIVGVYATCDLTTWTEALRFNAPTFARSFALYQGDFYFGEGTEASPLSAQAGNILRVSGSHFEANVPDCALQGMAGATN
jgi:hypothetical protein